MVDEKIENQLFSSMFWLMREFGRQFRQDDPEGITPTQFHTLMLLHERHTTTLMAMAEWLQVAGPTATRTIDALARKGFLLKDRDPQDRRIVWLRLTPEGVQQYVWEAERHRGALLKLFEALSSEEQRLLTRLLDKLGPIRLEAEAE